MPRTLAGEPNFLNEDEAGSLRLPSNHDPATLPRIRAHLPAGLQGRGNRVDAPRGGNVLHRGPRRISGRGGAEPLLPHRADRASRELKAGESYSIAFRLKTFRTAGGAEYNDISLRSIKLGDKDII